MRKRAILGFAALAIALLAQQPAPTCRHCSATYIPKSEFDAYLQRALDNNLNDQQVRAVDIGKSNVGIGIVRRGKLDQASNSGEGVAEHEQITEVYYIIEGSATLLTGHDLVAPKKRPDTMKTVREQNGPGYSASSIDHPTVTELKAGDVMVIPAGTGHWFTKIDDHIVYAMVRIDPDKVVPTKNETQSREYLRSPYKP